MVSAVLEEDHRPWGYYQVYADEPDHKVKRIVVYPGKRLSLQRHQRRMEHWYVLEGEAVVTRGDEELQLKEGESVNIPRGAVHRVRNPGTKDMAFRREITSGRMILNGWKMILEEYEECSVRF